MQLRSNMAMKFFALILFIGELLAPSLMASFEVPTSGGKAAISYQASVGHISTVFSETDSEERNQDDKHFSTTTILLTHTFLSVRPTIETRNFFNLLTESPQPGKSLFALHTLLLI